MTRQNVETDLFKMGKILTGISSILQMRKKTLSGADLCLHSSKEKNMASPGSPPPPMTGSSSFPSNTLGVSFIHSLQDLPRDHPRCQGCGTGCLEGPPEPLGRMTDFRVTPVQLPPGLETTELDTANPSPLMAISGFGPNTLLFPTRKSRPLEPWEKKSSFMPWCQCLTRPWLSSRVERALDKVSGPVLKPRLCHVNIPGTQGKCPDLPPEMADPKGKNEH